MSPLIREQTSVPAAPLQLLYAPIEAELAEVESVIHAEMRSRYPYVDEIVRYGCSLGGKRLRPALLLLAAKAAGPVRQEHYLLGAVVEMIHTATLVHDDVLDEADMRRHLPTVNSRWDNEASILLGDFLFSHAFYLASTLDSTLACRIIGRATNVVCEGELRQKGSRDDFLLSEAEYLEIIDGKTAELTACSCELGAHYAGANETLTRDLAGYGRDLGLAFQIVDDLLDIHGDPATVGKTLGSDLDQHKPTLPLIHAMERATAEDRTQLLNLLQSDRNDLQRAIWPYLERYDALEYARAKAVAFVDSARRRLQLLPASEAKRALMAIAEFVVQRKH